MFILYFFFFFQAEDGIRDKLVTGVQTCALPICTVQCDPMATREMFEILHLAEVELHRATAPFGVGGKEYAAGSVVVKVAQPYGAFAKTMLERQVYPDLRIFPGGPPKPPYDVTGHTLWMLMGVEVDEIAQPFSAPLERITQVTAAPSTVPMH